MIVDSDILIWFFRGNPHALRALMDAHPYSISSITMMELMQGSKNKLEQKSIIKQLGLWDVNVAHISEQISERAAQLVKDFSIGYGITIADALIAATAIEAGSVLYTANTKHFDFIPRLKTKKFIP